jgi:hypothetical protein
MADMTRPARVVTWNGKDVPPSCASCTAAATVEAVDDEAPAVNLVEELGRWRSWGGLLNACALLLFVLNTGHSIVLGGTRGGSV